MTKPKVSRIRRCTPPREVMTGEGREELETDKAIYDNVIPLIIFKTKVEHSEELIESPFPISNKCTILITSTTMQQLKYLSK